MKWHERLALVRRYGPADPPLRHLLEVLASYDNEEGTPVWPSVETLAGLTAYHPRSVTRYLGKLVRCGWVQPLKPARETRPYGREGRESMWAHGNVGGRKNSTHYRVTYRAETLTSCPPKHRQRVRVTKTAEAQTLTSCPETLTACPINTDTLSGDPSIDPLDPWGGGAPSPTPPPGKEADAGASAPRPAPAGAGWPAAARHLIQAAMKASGCELSTTDQVEAWERLMQATGVDQPGDVPRVVYDLVKHATTDHGKPLRPFRAVDLAPYVTRARAALDARRAFDHRLAIQKETA